LSAQGYFPAPLRGEYQVGSTLQGLFRHFRELLTRKSGKKEAELEALATLKRQAAQFELARLQGEFVRKAEIGPALRALSLHQRAKLQFKLENELAPNLAGLHPLEIRQKMAVAVDEICSMFRDGVGQWLESPPDTSALGQDALAGIHTPTASPSAGTAKAAHKATAGN
jgi:hypothetical protein